MPELQAARGASLSTVPNVGRSATWLAFAVAAVALCVDVLSKHLAVRELTGQAPRDLVGDFLQLQLVRNPGAAFSAGASFTPVITVVALVATAVVVYYACQVRHRVWAVALGLLLAGVAGNLLDRMFRAPGPFRGHVVDFFALPNWPVFNFADIFIDVAGGLIVIMLLRGVRLDGTRHEARPESGPETGPGTGPGTDEAAR